MVHAALLEAKGACRSAMGERIPPREIRLAGERQRATMRIMFSHVVICWTDQTIPSAADELIAGADKYLKPIPGALHYHVGRMATSHRPVVDQSYQVALNLVFPDQATQDAYQVHPSAH